MAALASTRRGVLGAIAVAPVMALPVTAIASSLNGSSIESMWSEMKCVMRARVEYWRRPEATTEGDAPLYDRIDKLQSDIAKCIVRTPREAEILLWIALDHCQGWGHFLTEESESAIPEENVTALRTGLNDLDFDAKAIVVALLGLRQEA